MTERNGFAEKCHEIGMTPMEVHWNGVVNRYAPLRPIEDGLTRWQYLAASYLHAGVGDVPGRDRIACEVGRLCYEAELRGDVTCLMHECSRLSGSLDRCPCQQCKNEAGRR